MSKENPNLNLILFGKVKKLIYQTNIFLVMIFVNFLPFNFIFYSYFLYYGTHTLQDLTMMS